MLEVTLKNLSSVQDTHTVLSYGLSFVLTGQFSHNWVSLLNLGNYWLQFPMFTLGTIHSVRSSLFTTNPLGHV